MSELVKRYPTEPVHVVEAEDVATVWFCAEVELDCFGHLDWGLTDGNRREGGAGGRGEDGEDPLVVPLLHSSVLLAPYQVVPHQLHQTFAAFLGFVERFPNSPSIVNEESPVDHDLHFSFSDH